MTSQSTNRSTACRVATGALTGAALAFGLIVGVTPTAAAQPTTSAPAPPPKPQMTADQALAIVARDYDLGSGGGQLSKLIDQVMTLRNRGLRASPANRDMIIAALDRRPDQKPLIEALQATLAYQRKLLAQSQAAPQAPTGGGAPPVAAPGMPGMPAWAPNNPMQQDGDTIFQMPGR